MIDSKTCQHLSKKVLPITSLTLCETCGEPVPGANVVPSEPPTWVPNRILLQLRAEGKCDRCKRSYEEGALIVRAGEGYAHATCPGRAR